MPVSTTSTINTSYTFSSRHSQQQLRFDSAVRIQSLYRGWLVRRMLITDVRDEFQSLIDEIERKAMVQRVRAHDGAVDEQKSTAALLLGRQKIVATYERSTLCKPMLPLTQPILPAKSIIARPQTDFDDSKQSTPRHLTTSSHHLSSINSSHEQKSTMESKEQAEVVSSTPAANDSIHHSSSLLSTFHEQQPGDSVLESNSDRGESLPAAAAASLSPAHASDFHGVRPLDMQIQSVQAAIRERLKFLRHDASIEVPTYR